MPSADAVARKARTEAKRIRREQRERDLAAKILALPEKRYGVILADPALALRAVLARNRHGSQRPTITMRPQTAGADQSDRHRLDRGDGLRPVSVVDAADGRRSRHAVMKAWGFKYKTQQAWDKMIPGTGYWAVD